MSGSNGPKRSHSSGAKLEAVKASLQEEEVPYNEPQNLTEVIATLHAAHASVASVRKNLLVVVNSLSTASNVTGEMEVLATQVSLVSNQIGSVAAKLAAVDRLAGQIDQQLATTTRLLNESTQTLGEIKRHTAEIPAMKQMLADILARLPS